MIEPDLVKPDLDRAVRAEQACRAANYHNNKAGSIVAGISIDDAETLLDWMTHNAKNAIISSSYGTSGETIETTGYERAKELLQSPQFVNGKCGICQSVIGYQSEMMGIDVAYHQVYRLHPQSTLSHAMNVLKIPIEDNGQIITQPVLVDTSFRQFYGVQSEIDWAGTLESTPKGKLLADKLLHKGYVLMDQDTAGHYVMSQARNDQIPFNPALLERSSVENDFDIDEIIGYGWDIRTPIMVKAGQPIQDVSIEWDRMKNTSYRASPAALIDSMITNRDWQPQGQLPSFRPGSQQNNHL